MVPSFERRNELLDDDVVQSLEDDDGVLFDIHARAVGVAFVLERDDLLAVALPRIALVRLQGEPGVGAAEVRVLGHEDVASHGRLVVDDDAACHLQTCELWTAPRQNELCSDILWTLRESRERFA